MDQFDVNRQMDAEAGDEVDAAMDLLEEDKEKTRERDGRLIHLSDGHYYDPLDGWVLVKQGSQYRKLRHLLLGPEVAEAEVETHAPARGFRMVKPGLYWNSVTRHLYIKNRGHYVLYSVHPLPEAP